MSRTRQSDLLLYLGLFGLALAIGQGQRESVAARDRREPLLFQLQFASSQGEVLRQEEVVGNENEPLVVEDRGQGSPRISLAMLPLGLPDGGVDLQLHLTVDGEPLAPMQGLKLTPGKSVEVKVPGQPLRLTVKAVRLEHRKRPLVS